MATIKTTKAHSPNTEAAETPVKRSREQRFNPVRLEWPKYPNLQLCNHLAEEVVLTDPESKRKYSVVSVKGRQVFVPTTSGEWEVRENILITKRILENFLVISPTTEDIIKLAQQYGLLRGSQEWV